MGGRFAAIVLASLLPAWLPPASVRAQEGGGGPIDLAPLDGCITPQRRQFAADLIEHFEVKFGPVSRPVAGQTPAPLKFYPLAGTLWDDLFTLNYVDLNPTTAFSDWDCLTYTYNNHFGNDTIIRSFDEQMIGVPVFAAQNGRVIAMHDGESDMNTSFGDQPANFVIIDHGLGRQAWYYHLKQNSILVGQGDFVVAGQQIALCGSSGNSTGPHLHFEIRDEDTVFEPFAGPCRAGDSGWVEQPAPERSVYLHDFGITHENLSSFPVWPNRWPADGQIAMSDPWIRIWFYGTNLPAQSTWKVRFRRPIGTLLPDGQTQQFNNAFWSWFYWWWSYDVTEMHSTPGKWHVLLSINGNLVIEAPIEVRAQRTSDFNRPPVPVTVRFEPATPIAGEVAKAVIDGPALLDDMEFDVVRYQYVWTIEGEPVRTITTASRSDMLPRNLLQSGQMVSCAVTPSDGELMGEPDTVMSVVDTPPVPIMSGAALAALAVLIGIGGCAVLKKRAVGSPVTSRQSSVLRFQGRED